MSPATAWQPVSVAWRPSCKPGLACTTQQQGGQPVPVRTRLLHWHGRGPMATNELMHNFDGALSNQEEWCTYRRHDCAIDASNDAVVDRDHLDNK
jgi:hypothetical protein